MGLAEAGRGDTGERFAAVGPVIEFDHDLVAGGHLDRRRREQHLLDETRIVRGDDKLAAGAEDIADDRHFLARDDARDAADRLARAAAGGAGISAHGDDVAREGHAGIVG